LQFSLLSGFFHWVFSKPEINVLIVGLDHAGKTVRLPPPNGAAPVCASAARIVFLCCVALLTSCPPLG
jgi:hypothetical protein